MRGVLCRLINLYIGFSLHSHSRPASFVVVVVPPWPGTLPIAAALFVLSCFCFLLMPLLAFPFTHFSNHANHHAKILGLNFYAAVATRRCPRPTSALSFFCGLMPSRLLCMRSGAPGFFPHLSANASLSKSTSLSLLASRRHCCCLPCYRVCRCIHM